ncbi:MAG: DUF4199 domain-containing protein [Eudoraea sp.]|uniref:DUF4199 domain-containing protein n=1 Tax=Eudoraea sp. TaxID=1979955 RepID=UPI003C745D8F
MKNTVFKFGAYGFFFALLVFLLVLYFGKELESSIQVIIGYVTMTLSSFFIFFGIKHYRDIENNGKVSFGQALLIGILIALIIAIGIAIADYIYTTVLNPGFFEEYKAMMRADGYEGTIPEYSSVFMAMLMSVTVLCIGFVVSLLSTLLLQRK